MQQAWKRYPSCLTDRQWQLIKRFIPGAKKGGRPRTTDVRSVINAILYLNRNGCAWRYLPQDFPPWQTVYDYFWKWRKSGLWFRIYEHLHQKVRLQAGRKPYPSILIVDAQSVKASLGKDRSYDGFKKVIGRKRHLLVDSLGLVCKARVGPATPNSDTEAGIENINRYIQSISRKHRPLAVWADGGYREAFKYCVEKHAMTLHAKKAIYKKAWNKKTKKMETFMLQSNFKPIRWRVERTFAWFNHYRRHSRDYEKLTSNSEAQIMITMTAICLNRLAKHST